MKSATRSTLTGVERKKQCADQRGQRLSWLWQECNGPKHKGRYGLSSLVKDNILINQVGYHKIQKFTRALSEHTVAATEWPHLSNRK